MICARVWVGSLISYSYAKSLRASWLRFRGVSRAGLPTGSGWIKEKPVSLKEAGLQEGDGGH